MTSLFEALPAEIILQIHLISTSSSLPYLSKYINSVINSNSTPSYRSQWLLERLSKEGYGPAPSPRRLDDDILGTCSNSIYDNTNSQSHLYQYSSKLNRRISKLNRSLTTSKGIRGLLDDSHKSEYIDASFLNKALKFPICNLETILLLEKECLNNLNDRLQFKYEESKQRSSMNKDLNSGSISIRGNSRLNVQRKGAGLIIKMGNGIKTNTNSAASDIPSPPPFPKFLPLPPKTIDIPKRLFRNLTPPPPPSSSSSSSDQSPPTPSDQLISRSISGSSSSISSIDKFETQNSITTTTKTTKVNTTNITKFEKEDLPLLLYILKNLQGNPNSNKGYPLSKSVICKNLSLIKILLEFGADPTIKNFIAVMLAIGSKNLELVKLLIELPNNYDNDRNNSLMVISHEKEISSTTTTTTTTSSSSSSSSSSPSKAHNRANQVSNGTEAIAESSSSSSTPQSSSENSRKRKRCVNDDYNEDRTEPNTTTTRSISSTATTTSSSKRRKIEDRFKVTSEMLELAVKLEYEPLIQFFMSKGAIPNLKTLQMLQM